MQHLLLATTNPDKLREIRRVLARIPVEIVTLGDLPQVRDPEETGTTFEENARLKALYYDAAVGNAERYTVAEDSGLVIDALNGQPGVHSARFLRPDASYPERFSEIYRRLAPHSRPWVGRFVCAVAVVHRGALMYETTGIIEGWIADAPRGEGGFGYDPIFYYPPYDRTLAETSEEQKLSVAHRGQAFRQLAIWLEQLG